ncbi:MAG: CRISPR-associated protein [Alphaproteobacteria bacterium ADurb.Bin438]|nr:MAG: CRISPR-associated protein [Alphaproteobacteria bacterium ADurb.Bin438]
MAHYLIKLKPYDKFFFGTEKGFGADNQNYFVQSAYFPQQTALLGLLRYQLLCQAGETVFANNKIVDKKVAKDLIGENSFTVGVKNDFGKIKSLSPLFLIKKDKELYPLNREYQDVKKDEEKNPNWQMRNLLFEDNNVLLSDYNPKLDLPDLLFCGEEKYKYDDIFKEVQQVGIRKNYEGKTDDKAFYMQTFYSFKERDTSFAFYAEIDVELQSNPLVYLGGERQAFSMKVEKDKKFDPNILVYQSTPDIHKLVLISDAYFNGNINEYCDFALTDLVNFRSLATSIHTEKYYDIGKNDKVKKSSAFQLYKKGSVFYSRDEKKLNDLKEKLEKSEKSEFYTIGYNYSKIILKS